MKIKKETTQRFNANILSIVKNVVHDLLYFNRIIDQIQSYLGSIADKIMTFLIRFHRNKIQS